MDNPYTPPVVAPAEPSGIALYSAGHIAWASFLGAPLAGGVVMAFNYWRLGKSREAQLALVLGLVATVIIIAIALALPDNFPNSLVPATYTFGIYLLAKRLQGHEYELGLARGGARASGWVPTGIGILSMIVVLAALVVILLFGPDSWIDEGL